MDTQAGVADRETWSTHVKSWMSVGLVMLGALAFGDARAQDGSGGEAGMEPNVIYRKKTVFSFEGDMIDGDLLSPDAAYVESRKRVRHSSLIRVREDFRSRVLESVTEL